MGTPLEALPSVTVEGIQALLSTLDLPPTSNIEILSTKAEYHIIALIQFQTQIQEDMILRVAGSHVPKLKTENEVTVIKWLQANTTIPVPCVVRYDSTIANPLGCEYILQEKVPGQSLDKVWPSLSGDERIGVLDFAADFLLEMTKVAWDQVGSLVYSEGHFSPAGSILDERFWEQRDIDKFWPSGLSETTETLNPLGPYRLYVEYSAARLEKYVHAIRNHPSLEFMRRRIGTIECFIAALRREADLFNKGAKLCLAHRDFHMGNIMYDTTAKKVSGVLDWEFSVVLPLQQGDLSRAFLYDMQGFEGWDDRKSDMLKTMKKRCEERGLNDVLARFEYTSKRQQEMQRVVDLLRAIVEVSPRGQREIEKAAWAKECRAIMMSWLGEEWHRKHG